jgi:uncharacterized damage-inducible protein DinB
MNAAYFRRMIDYTYWANRKVWGCIEELSDEQFKHPFDYSIGSIHQQVVHMMDTEWLWLRRVRGEQPDAVISTEDYPTREKVRARWDQVEAGWKAFTAALTDEHVAQTIEYVSVNGLVRRSQPMWEGLAQIVNHATDHRSQTLALIHQVGGKTLAQDFIFYSWENPIADTTE